MLPENRVTHQRRVVADDEDDEFTQRLDFKVSVETKNYLAALKRRKTHGNTNTAIVRRFIDEGIQRAIEKGYINLEDGQGK